MLWDNIYNFFVQYVFGGILYDGNTYSFVNGLLPSINPQNGTVVKTSTAEFTGVTLLNLGGDARVLPLGNYLSLICTIISIVFVVVLCCLFVYKIIKLIGGLIR